MADIISLDEKLQLPREKRAALIKKRKISAVQKVFQCAQCVHKCRKCGVSINSDYEHRKNDNYNLRVPYRLCGTCAEEYLYYIEWLKGKKNPDYYWHNEVWIDVWSKWIEYQHANDSYLKSNEFKQLLQELKETGIEN